MPNPSTLTADASPEERVCTIAHAQRILESELPARMQVTYDADLGWFVIEDLRAGRVARMEFVKGGTVAQMYRQVRYFKERESVPGGLLLRW